MSNLYLVHYGVKGMHWGVRRYQNYDGTRIGAKHRNQYTLGDHLVTKYKAKGRNIISVAKNVIEVSNGQDTLKKAFNDVRKDFKENDSVVSKSFSKLDTKRKVAATVIAGAEMVAESLLIPTPTLSAAADLKKVKLGQTYFNRCMDNRIVKNFNPDNLKDIDVVIKSGEKMGRVSSVKQETYEGAKRLYVANEKEDIIRYREKMPDFIKKWSADPRVTSVTSDKAYYHNLKAAKDIKIMSEKKQYDLFKELQSSGKINKGHTWESFNTNLNIYGEKLKTGTSVQEHNFNTVLSDVNTYIDTVKSRGYQGLHDFNDAGKLAKSPKIIFEPNDNIVYEGYKTANTIRQKMNILLEKDIA